MYSPKVLDHFQHPRNVGDLSNASVSAELQNPACGDVLRLSLRVENNTIAEARFRAKGCVPAMACASALTESLVGKTVFQAQELSGAALAESLGALPPHSAHAADLAIEALRAALSQIK